PDEFLQIEVNADGNDAAGHLGVLTVTDTHAVRAAYTLPLSSPKLPPSVGTYGVFIKQLKDVGATVPNGDLEATQVITSGDATMTTAAGSIRDARFNGAGDNSVTSPFNVQANNVDLKATGGSIGDKPSPPDATGNDLKIDSSNLVVGRVGLE